VKVLENMPIFLIGQVVNEQCMQR